MESFIATGTEKKLRMFELIRIMEEHYLPSFCFNGHVYGVIPFINYDTLQQGYDITDITNFSLQQMRTYLGY